MSEDRVGPWEEILPLIDEFCKSVKDSKKVWPELKLKAEEMKITKKQLRGIIEEKLLPRMKRGSITKSWIPEELKDPKNVEKGRKLFELKMEKQKPKEVPVIIDEKGAIKYAEGRGEVTVGFNEEVNGSAEVALMPHEQINQAYNMAQELMNNPEKLQAGGMPLTVVEETVQKVTPVSKFVIPPNDKKLLDSLYFSLLEATGQKEPDVQLDKGDVFKGIVIEYLLSNNEIKEIYALWGPSSDVST